LATIGLEQLKSLSVLFRLFSRPSGQLTGGENNQPDT
jgi:hypothetical protein